jgi:SPX domain protein involved in polyphosphate accumulation
MKFGKTLLANQIPEWSRNYISYKALKVAIKAATAHLPPPEEEITGKLFNNASKLIVLTIRKKKPSFSNWIENWKRSIRSLSINRRLSIVACGFYKRNLK